MLALRPLFPIGLTGCLWGPFKRVQGPLGPGGLGLQASEEFPGRERFREVSLDLGGSPSLGFLKRGRKFQFGGSLDPQEPG